MATAEYGTPGRPAVAVIGGGPAGLMAAEALATAGLQVDLFDAMPSVGRKFLLAGKGGLNLTHAEPFEAFIGRYAAASSALEPMLRDFGPQALRDWARGLGVETFIGSSSRVFPSDLKAAPLLRAWLSRLRGQGVRFHQRHRWTGGFDPLVFETPAGPVEHAAGAVVLALGGASWPQLGSDGAWVDRLPGIEVAPLQPSNCGFDVDWSGHLRDRFAGQALKNVAIAFGDFHQAGEFVVTEGGVEGSLVYAASGPLRDAIARDGEAVMHVDLLPQREAAFVAAEVARPRGSRSMSTHLKSRLGLDGVKAGLLHEALPREAMHDAARIAATLKSLPVRLTSARPVAESISTAGGVRFEACDEGLMATARPGVFFAGEMLDWEAPTGGYLLTACFATGLRAGRAAADFATRER